MNQLLIRAQEKITLLYPQKAVALIENSQTLSTENQIIYFSELIKAARIGNLTFLKTAHQFKTIPVDVETFICSEKYLNKKTAVYPAVLRELKEICSGRYNILLAVGGTGSAKTTVAIYATVYQLYILSCMVSPHEPFGLDPSSEIYFIFQSLNKKISDNSFNRLRSIIEASPYFNECFQFDRKIKSRLIFPNFIHVIPASGHEHAAIGQNVFGGLMDELNFMSLIEKSKKSIDQGEYNQAVQLYNSIAIRRKMRFNKAGSIPGLLCLVSSRRYPGQFTDKIEEQRLSEIAQYGKSDIYLYDKCVWEVKTDAYSHDDGIWKPYPYFSMETFKAFGGDTTRKPRILEENEQLSERDNRLVVDIPIDFRGDFDRDIIKSLRDIAGVSTLASHPFFIETEKVYHAFGKHASILSRERCDFIDSDISVIQENIKYKELERFAHIDLAITGDSAGVAIGCCTGFKQRDNGEFGPVIHIDCILEVAPPRNGEILFYKIRDLLVDLRNKGLQIKWVTFDTFQSKDSQQLLRQLGFITGVKSLDKDTTGYEILKQAVYDERIAMPLHTKCTKELITLERDTKKNRVDHPPQGSKDCADALAGVVWGLNTRLEIWNHFGVQVIRN